MVTVASKFFEGVGFRGMYILRGMLRFTLMRFEDQDDAELWALKLLMRYRGIFAPSPTLPQMQENFGEGE